MGRPRRLTTARGMAASGTRRARVAGVGGDARRGSLEPALTTMVKGRARLFGEAVEGGVELAGDLIGLGDLGDEQREGLVARRVLRS